MNNKDYLIAMDISKAESLAHWSFIGILFPVIGIIVGSASLSRIRDIEGDNAVEEQRLARIRHTAGVGIGISIFLILLSILIIWVLVLTFSKL